MLVNIQQEFLNRDHALNIEIKLEYNHENGFTDYFSGIRTKNRILIHSFIKGIELSEVSSLTSIHLIFKHKASF